VINSNPGPISHCYWATSLLAKNRRFCPPPLI